MDILGKLFGSSARVKLMRIFLMNSERGFETGDLVTLAKVKKQSAQRELNMLKSIGFIRQKTFTKEFEQPKNKKTGKHKNRRTEKVVSKIIKKKVRGWFLNPKFPYLASLKPLLVGTELYKEEDLTKRFKSSGTLKLLVVGGVFMHDKSGRVDLIMVGSRLRPRLLDEVIKKLEAEIGCELRYAVFDTDEFAYRLNMNDKFIRDIFDYPHKIIIDSLGFSTGSTKES